MNKGEPDIFSIPVYETFEYQNYELWQDILGCTCGGVYQLTENSKVLLSYPERFEHKCNRCGNIVAMNCAYPRKYMKLK